MTGTHHDTGNDVGGGLPGLGVHIGQRDLILPWHLSADQRDQGRPSVPRVRRELGKHGCSPRAVIERPH